MKTFALLACFCAVAQAQFGNPQGFGRGSSPFGSQQAPVQSSRGVFQSRNAVQQQPASLRQEVAAPAQFAGACRELNERYPVSGSCDRYIECINGTAEEKLCPDGLRFDADVNFNVYPCKYPNEIPCLERSSLQPPQPTADCPNQFGIFKTGDSRNCSGFRNCVNGVGHDFTCPEGLAFSSSSYRCEWPDEVEDCDAEAFLGFRCPEVPISKELGPPAGFRYYRSDTDCQKYFLCIEGRPRVLACGGDSAFDDLTTTCVSADQVSACPPELRAAAADARELEQQRLAKQLQYDEQFARNPPHKRRF
ncbi:protein obstructor-E [Plutella xylostella]|uniref:protein obstructor-E n=1 Tax=Plutella xylostella TaxID=51655 RepID=UPI002032631D|nr:protein obstructor-E [Plutella xylostella]